MDGAIEICPFVALTSGTYLEQTIPYTFTDLSVLLDKVRTGDVRSGSGYANNIVDLIWTARFNLAMMVMTLSLLMAAPSTNSSASRVPTPITQATATSLTHRSPTCQIHA